MDGDALFVDTNVLVYARVVRASHYGQATRRLEEEHRRGTALWVSRQVLREYLTTLSRPQSFSDPVSAAELCMDVRRFEQRFHVADEDAEVTARLLDLVQRYTAGGKQVHDANVVATMLTHGVRRLLTHNVQDFRRFGPEIEVVPLVMV